MAVDPVVAMSLEEPLLDVEQAAALLNVRPSWIRDATRAGRLPCVRVGRHLRFTRPMLEHWAAQHRIDNAGTGGAVCWSRAEGVMSASRDDAPVPSEASGRTSVFEVAETTVGALIAVDASDPPADDARGVRGDELEEWFARAASGVASDGGDAPAREFVGAATLPPQDAVVRPRPASMRTPGAARDQRMRGRSLALAPFAPLALVSVVVAVVMARARSDGRST